MQYYKYRVNAFGVDEVEWQTPPAEQATQTASVGGAQGSYGRFQQEQYQEGEDTPTNRRSHETQYSHNSYNSYGSSSDFSYGQQPGPTSSNQYTTPVASQYSSPTPTNTILYAQRQDQNYLSQPLNTNPIPTNSQYQAHVDPNAARTPSRATLDSNFQVIPTKKQKHFFVQGKVFSILWPEPKGVKTDADERDAATIAKLGENMFVEVRRFVIVNVIDHHSLCVPISTHRGRGILGRNPDHYSIIFTGTAQPLEGEAFNKFAIEVIPEDGETLASSSRVNYAQTYTVQHNVRVKAIGKVNPDHMPYVKRYWQEFTQAR